MEILEKMTKEELLAVIKDYESHPLILPGVGEVGRVNLPHILRYYSEDEDCAAQISDN